MKLSIIIPTFNSASVLKRALGSIASQTFSDYEVLVMDGDSKDDTVKIAYSTNDSRIKVLSEPDKGIYDAMNKGIKKAKGEWIYFLGSDDCLLDSTVLESIFSRNISNVEIIYGDVESEALDSRCKGEWTIDTIWWNRCHQAIFYHKSVFELCGYYNLKYKTCADYEMNLRWFFNKHIRSLYIPLDIACFSSEGISSTSIDSVFFMDYEWLMLKYGHSSFSFRQNLSLVYSILRKLIWSK